MRSDHGESDDPAPSQPGQTTEAAERSERHAVVRGFRLTVLDGPDSGTVFASTNERVGIGTHERNQLVLRDNKVSRFHCSIEVANGVTIRDLGSTNGTVVDGVSVVHAQLHDNAVIALGDNRIQFTLGEDQQIPLSDRQRFGVMVGRSVAMRAAFVTLERAAQSDVTVLLEGETGTGKEAAAESIHRESRRAEGPFVVVDCGAIPPDLLESELFGHERGSFTGAVAERQGAFEAASGGTVFFDEIGELSLDLQPKLLRALERREIKRVGSNHHVPVDVRVIAATNRELATEVNAKRFRADLYYRLAVLEIRLPPLRERKDDLPLLVAHMLWAIDTAESPETAFVRSREFIDSLARHQWPGNVRELRNYLERCVALHRPSPLGKREADPAQDADLPFRVARDRFTQRYLETVMRRENDNVAAVARATGLDRIYLYRLLRKHGLR